MIVTEEQRARLMALFQKQQAKSALAAGSAAAARGSAQLPDAKSQSQSQLSQNPVLIPGRPFIEVDASYLPAPHPEADQDPGGLAEGWGLDHPELS